jgi:hypothetical protein
MKIAVRACSSFDNASQAKDWLAGRLLRRDSTIAGVPI